MSKLRCLVCSVVPIILVSFTQTVILFASIMRRLSLLLHFKWTHEPQATAPTVIPMGRGRFLRRSRRAHEGLASSMPSHEARLDLHLFYGGTWQRGGTTSWQEWLLTYSACACARACMSMLGHSLWGELSVNHSPMMRGVTGQFIATLPVLSCTFKRDLYSYNAKAAQWSRPAHLQCPLGHEVTAPP